MIHRLAVPIDLSPSLTGAASANNFIPTTLSGNAPHIGTASIAKDATTLTTTALTHTPSVSLNLSVSYLSLTTAPPLKLHAIAQQPHSMPDTTQMIGVTMVRIPLTMIMTGKPDVCNN